MHIELVAGDITTLEIDAIVTAANSALRGGGGVDAAVHRAAGRELKRASQALAPCPPGHAVVTRAFGLEPAVKHVVHAVGPRFGVDEDICTGDHACIRLSGCPSLSVKSLDDPLRDDPVAHIDQTCVGCGKCGEVADAAVLCPSFYRADVVHNPGGWDRFVERARRALIGFLQRRRESRRLVFSDA